MEYFGLFNELRKLNMPNSVDSKFYEGFYADLFDSYSQLINYDIPIILEQAAGIKGPILDLGCGSGRILMNIAKAGYKVTGIELSKDMLRISEQRKTNLSKEIEDRISLVHGDITNFKLNQTFSMAVFTGGSMSILKDTTQLERMLQRVSIHLRVGGIFILDYIVPGKYQFLLRDGRVVAITKDISINKKQFVLVGELERDERTALVNFYSEVIESDKTFRYFGSTMKTYFTGDDIALAIKNSGLNIKKEMKINNNEENIVVLILEK